ncbi:TPA: S-adenosylhomocysteine hydrolase [Vibrio parahaemolyticus]|nr:MULTISPECIES: DUF6088 family protein [Vibrio]EWS67294.1 S-adenosylhomocysteine hydrolase [Vibrio vulnificus BAA87]EJE4182578.1 S-adenosylhomocysteine hydrolase [Vibrio parahaemolyticus]ELA9713032.1 S-adenosylhomocysteine hydrolase [Vibrio parahaemolyticus]ELA9726540.1 S-adenosylhomocysteine hydrolase [Vibrio parahaemolyticus]KFK59717.1 S-adenosylhomocysteine hydrolase [Vibrio vulnificus]
MSTLLQRVKARITRTRSKSVFVRSDFSDLGGYDQIGRALRILISDGLIMKMGYGVYIKARRNRLTNELMPDIEGGTDAAFMEALARLKVDFDVDALTKNYLSGKMTQIPAKTELIIKKRFSRKLAVGDVTLND